MKVRRKSLWRSKNTSTARARQFANMRAAKERKRLERVSREEPMPDTSGCYVPQVKPSGFRITITCLDDGERVSFKTVRLPWGLSISPTKVAQRVAKLLGNYLPATQTA